ncbi:hypothetical protein BDP81DRAFT_92746 [Colletotrichum phormii]|uniref:Uncharacterized protein n=1 Tax=Colletotrichum phormii TaxID=359342 RepID=A0AAJ0A213_9PEZI|nr:uncharacterized protein BDP81DRAFT_92746 [Colletotrichum phormii]KAK1655018.1 hypothetical protein BDP81DRAFT_92746 [Colletotrichum phormii]
MQRWRYPLATAASMRRKPTEWDRDPPPNRCWLIGYLLLDGYRWSALAFTYQNSGRGYPKLTLVGISKSQNAGLGNLVNLNYLTPGPATPRIAPRTAHEGNLPSVFHHASIRFSPPIRPRRLGGHPPSPMQEAVCRSTWPDQQCTSLLNLGLLLSCRLSPGGPFASAQRRGHWNAIKTSRSFDLNASQIGVVCPHRGLSFVNNLTALPRQPSRSICSNRSPVVAETTEAACEASLLAAAASGAVDANKY